MQFVRNGPDLPERLLQAHEDGRVVIFCGAGVSYPARLPGFEGLVKSLYKSLLPVPNAVQEAVIKARQYDTAIGLLEGDIVGGREVVRRALARILVPNLTAPNATTTHEALLTLGKGRDGHIRLITTNFDRLFEEVIAAKSLSVERFQAPLLPVPKNRWNGLVYLHGLLTSTPTTNDLDRLVISSGDFGLAYLTERWAARFVSELFRNYTVCFVGYSINDPVLRYMMDALAADRLLGESPPEMFAFGSYSKGKETERANEWRAKNVTPILYREHNRHALLHKTLHAWAATYRDGVRGKERIVSECAMVRPLASTQQDDFVGRLLWALSDSGGLPAKRFADLDPVPSLDWLEPLSEERYCQSDLIRFGVPPSSSYNDSLAFSLTCRPPSYDLAPLMALVDAGARGSRWDEVMKQIARWLIRHLNDPTLLLWLVKRGGQLHENLVWWIESRLDELAKLERDGSTAKLESILANAPNAVPGLSMRTLWRLLLTGRIKSSAGGFDLYRWRDRFKRDGLTTSLRLELREILAPRVSLREPFRHTLSDDDRLKPQRIRDLVGWDIVLSTNHVHSGLLELPKDSRWIAALPDLLSDFNSLLRDTLDLMHELDGAGESNNLSYMYRPSISEHPQNKDYRDWTALVDLTRDAWLATTLHSPEHARLAAQAWWQAPYSLFKRLAFFAAAQGNVISRRQGLGWLLSDRHYWLWSVDARREVMRFLATLGPKTSHASLLALEKAILAGPPRSMFRDDIEPEHWAHIFDHQIWLRLVKIVDGGAILNSVADDKLRQLSIQNPEWQLAPDERDEFPYWTGSGDELRKFIATPRSRRELTKWLKEHPNDDHWQNDDWLERCRENFATTACALYALTKAGDWPIDRWREALQAWSEEKLLKRSWRYIGPLLAHAPDEVFQALVDTITWWLQAIAKVYDEHEELFFLIVRRVLALHYESDNDIDEPVMHAINHPIGHVTEALLRSWHRTPLEDGEGLPQEIRDIFSDLCRVESLDYRHGRVLLAANVIALFRVDRHWATQYLLLLFDWQNSELEARAAWNGFLWSPRLYRPLMEILKPAFLATAHHYELLGKHAEQYASLLVFAALDSDSIFTTAELASATRALPQKGLHDTAQALVRALDGTSERREDYWKNRVVPYLHSIWPRTRDNISLPIAENLARLCVEAQDSFPEALGLLRGWLQPLPHPDYLVHQLQESGLCNQFPESTLEFLGLVVGDRTHWRPSELGTCLSAIRSSAPVLETDLRYERLMTYARQH